MFLKCISLPKGRTVSLSPVGGAAAVPTGALGQGALGSESEFCQSSSQEVLGCVCKGGRGQLEHSPGGKAGLLFAHLYGTEHEKTAGKDHLRGDDWDMRPGTGAGRTQCQHFTTTPTPRQSASRSGLRSEEEIAYDLTRPRPRSSRVRDSPVSRQPFPSWYPPAPFLTPHSVKTQIKRDLSQRASSGCRSVPLSQTLPQKGRSEPRPESSVPASSQGPAQNSSWSPALFPSHCTKLIGKGAIMREWGLGSEVHSYWGREVVDTDHASQKKTRFPAPGALTSQEREGNSLFLHCEIFHKVHVINTGNRPHEEQV
ncbi:hypothetical protein Cadr_000003318 [Camelus dromedarius]|uniref:Uncharacterized protein n=1 Tax=Camelus dromedarius TaxID=9838 RepID=A0A5N4C253_CAMDR|nr:hypothetical protein Cadr_000003318 [Camelus dromedarius]